ncbi:MAG: hypothetical protein K9I59_05835 [Chlorobium sp.]|nr:hypothetical protein [Chlorobium sp.]MCF8216262.1 hypothetical protein [Chlorobium sp.]MCF8271164.1 hypothetical protein [Chlorobium sp.]MCF8287572.1 hypothetical protein [Chlorobium sp.]
MGQNTIVLKWSLLAGALYFFAVACVHLVGFKVPVLYIYFDVPSSVYQDRIISFLAFGWAACFFTAYSEPEKYRSLVRAILFAGAYAIVMLCIINGSADVNAAISVSSADVFRVETAGLFFYWLWLLVFFFRSRASRDS